MSHTLAPDYRSSTFIVIPAFNEAATIGRVVTELRRQWPRVVVIDDGSSDRTVSAARAAGAEVLEHAVNRGQGAALQTGISYGLLSGARCLVTFDADGQHRSEELDRLVEPVASGRYDIALGSRFLEPGDEVPILRKILLKGAVLFTRVASGMRITDTHNGLRALSKQAAQRIELRVDRMAHASEILDQIASSGLAYVEVPVHVRYTRHSRAKGQSNLDAVRVLLDYLLARVFR